MSRKVVMYHAGCVDGFCSAMLLKMYFDTLGGVHAFEGDFYIPMHYGMPIPKDQLKETDDVYLVDFSFKREQMLELAKFVNFVTVIDHHKTAEEELKNLTTDATDPIISVFFDSERSGAKLTEDWIEARKKAKAMMWKNGVGRLPPANDCSKLVAYVQDRDLWLHKLPYTKEVSAHLQMQELDFTVWQTLYESFEKNFDFIVETGSTILTTFKVQANISVSHAQDIEFPTGAGHRLVKIVNTTVHHSDIGNMLCQQHDIPFSVTWFQRSDFKFVYSLRSIGDFDVSAIAKAYGGGGHKNAAGFVSDSLVTGLGKCFQKL